MSNPISITTEHLSLSTQGSSDIIDITPNIIELLQTSNMKEGNVLLFVSATTAALATMEYEPGLLKDFPDFFRRAIPKGKHYQHEAIWQDDTGHSHIRSSLLGPYISIPFADSKLLLGKLQQIVLIDFDTRPRERNIVAQFMGTTA